MAASGDAANENIVLASFPTRHAAEHMLLSLGRGFRREVRKRRALATVIRANSGGSLKVTASRVVNGGNVVNDVLHIIVFRAIGFFGIIGTLKVGRQEDRAVHVREGHVGERGDPIHAILAEAGPKAAVVLVRCEQATLEMVATRAADSAVRHWDGSLQDFLGALEPQDDWVRRALGEPLSARR